MGGINMDVSYQGKLVGVDPDDAEVGVVGVLLRHLLQDFQELITVWVSVQENRSDKWAGHYARSNPESHTWVVLLGEGNDVLSVNVVLLWTRKDAENVRVCQCKQILSGSFSYPDLIHAVRVKLPQSGPGTFKTTEGETGLVLPTPRLMIG